ncbi:hypothetical protein KKF25_02820, partial [Patescibacteria group bacterium]|nr:hypothetical protein [Patescibacteria group bacterium]
MENQELPRRALNLSLAIYRVTAIFPQGEVLVGQLRELGNEIAGDLAEENFADVENKINRLKIYFAVAKAQNWVKPMNWSILDFEYYKLQREVVFGYRESTRIGNLANKHELDESENIMSHNIEQVKKPAVLKPVKPSHSGLSERQLKITEALGKSAAVKMSDLIPL